MEITRTRKLNTQQTNRILFQSGYLVLAGFLMLLISCTQSAVPPNLVWAVYEQEVTDQSQLEFSVTQNSGVDMLVKAWGFEVEFELVTTDLTSQAKHRTRTPYIRLGPQFQLLKKQERNSEVRIILTPINKTKNAHASIEVYELSDADQASRKQIDAYNLVSEALESTQSEDEALWLNRIEKLETAVKYFRSLELNETRLWIESYVNYFTYFPIYHYDKAVHNSHQLGNEARNYGQRKIELLALQIQGQALMERNSIDSVETANKKAVEAQLKFDEAIEVAIQLGLEFEQAWITSSKGIGYAYSGNYAKSLEFDYKAKVMAKSLSDDFLQSMVQSNIVATHIEFGETTGAIEALSKIAASDPVKNNPFRTAMINDELAKLHITRYEFPEAINDLNSAIAYFESVGDRESHGRALYSLAYAYAEMGNIHRAIMLLNDALPMLSSANYGRGLYDVHRLLANFHRNLEKYKEMSHNRSEQQKYLFSDHERAAYLFEYAKDLYAQGLFVLSQDFFNQSIELARSTKRFNLETISGLYICLLEYDSEGDSHPCFQRLQMSWPSSILAITDIRRKFEGLFLWAQINLKEGKLNEAFEVLDALVSDIKVYRLKLPGILGAWFWENNKRVFETYLTTSVIRHEEPSVSAIESFIAIQKIKNITTSYFDPQSTETNRTRDAQFAIKVRELIVKSDHGKSNISPYEIQDELDEMILAMASGSSLVDHKFDGAWLSDVQNQLPDDSAILTMYVFSDNVLIWVVTKMETRLTKLMLDYDVNSEIAQAMMSMRHQGGSSIQPVLAKLGRTLLLPVVEDLPATIFFLPIGKLNGFPLDALILDNKYLIERHQVVNIQSLETLRSVSGDGIYKVDFNRIFVASNEFFNDVSIADLPGATNEVVNLKNLFSESEILFADGRGLSLKRFYSSEVASADIIHLASHAELNASYPSLSKIYINDNAHNNLQLSDVFITPADIRACRFNADLIFLSACQTSGLNEFSFDSNLGFVNEFISSGAKSVVASLWPVADSDTELLVGYFYAALKRSANVNYSLTSMKREFIKKVSPDDVEVWAAFQLYL